MPWIEIQSSQKSNIICGIVTLRAEALRSLLAEYGIVYRQHNSPKRFQEYFDEPLEKQIASNKLVYITGDFNINFLHAESSRYAQEFLLSLQSSHLYQLLINQHVCITAVPP